MMTGSARQGDAGTRKRLVSKPRRGAFQTALLNSSVRQRPDKPPLLGAAPVFVSALSAATETKPSEPDRVLEFGNFVARPLTGRSSRPKARRTPAALFAAARRWKAGPKRGGR